MSIYPMNDVVLTLVKDYIARHKAREAELGPIFQFWQKERDMCARSTFPAHFTASAVVRRHGAIVLIHHKILDKWLFPGGHIDANEHPQQAALRELKEEAGFVATPVHEWVIDIDCHVIPANEAKGEREHYHLDLAFLFEANAYDFNIDRTEILDARWVDVKTLAPDTRAFRSLLKTDLL